MYSLDQDLHVALNSLGLNPTDQEVVDIPVKIARKGLIYFPDFCMICLRYLKKDEDEQFHHWMFKVATPIFFMWHSKHKGGRVNTSPLKNMTKFVK